MGARRRRLAHAAGTLGARLKLRVRVRVRVPNGRPATTAA